jgi:hypothetical protein
MAKKSHDMVSSLIERIDWMLSEDDPLTEKLRGLSNSELMDTEFELILEALDRLENRAFQTRVKTA